MYYRSFREQFKSILSERNLRVSDIARQIGVTPARLSFLIASDKVPQAMIENVAKVIECDPWDFDQYVVSKSEEMLQQNYTLLEFVREIGMKPNGRKTKRAMSALKELF